jgi:ubiquinone/menaquinone biosynthesis C-methylase UbiE
MASTGEVYRYWQAESCGTEHASCATGTRAYYDEIEAARYGLEPFIPGFAEFELWRGRRVLEIGIGAATDFINFARAGARVTGIDLTPAAIKHAERRLRLEGLEAELAVGSGERLPYADQSFDLVYSWGVIHHAENPARVLREARRVLAANGEVRAMLYGRHSWVAYGLWLRHALLAGHPSRSLADVVASHMESPGTRAYTRGELETLFAGAGFDQVRVSGFATRYDQRAVGRLARIVRRDWFLGVVAT